jgi:glucose-1-phosphate cytidylyltransferase
MKVAILAGGVGSRLMEETVARPKPMVEIGGKPILWHIMKYYASFGHREFVIALGYRGEYIKRWFVDYAQLTRDLTVELGTGTVTSAASGQQDDWCVQLVDTGQTSGTGGRVRRLREALGDERFLLTWGDGVSTVDIEKLIDFHESHGLACTLTAVRPPARFGHLVMEGDVITRFDEKPQVGEGWINGAFFVCEPEIFDYLDEDDAEMFERGPLPRLTDAGQLAAYRHHGFWQCMDTLRDRVYLESLWESGEAPWRRWEA